jgi:hypothetical protein
LIHEVQRLRAQVGDAREIDTAWMLEHPGNPLLPLKVGRERWHAGHAACEGGGVEEELSPVHRHSHRYDHLVPRAWLSAKDDLHEVREVLREVHRLMVDRQGAIAQILGATDAWHLGPSPSWPRYWW